MRKKIALFSCHRDPNYGSMLQAYALAEAIKQQGWEAEYIDYYSLDDPRKLFRRLKWVINWPLKKVKGLLRSPRPKSEFSFFSAVEFANTTAAFKRFHKEYIPVSNQRYFYDTIKRKLKVEDYCNYIVGSDQTWSPLLYMPKKSYFLDFAELPRRNAYAPSMGTTNVPDEFKKLLTKKLRGFNNLSCREAANSKMLTELLGREVKHVLDPTLLLKRTDWDKIATKSQIEGEYILVYLLGEKDTIIKFAEMLAQRYQLPLYYVLTRPKYMSMKNLLSGVGPDDWVGLVRNARYVVTDSYHGVLFSVNYNVNFYAFSKREGGLDSEDNGRIVEFLKFVGLEERFQDDKNNPKIISDIDYSKANKVIRTMRINSLDYLKTCLDS